jgi:hypothetical protein
MVRMRILKQVNEEDEDGTEEELKSSCYLGDLKGYDTV